METNFLCSSPNARCYTTADTSGNVSVPLLTFTNGTTSIYAPPPMEHSMTEDLLAAVGFMAIVVAIAFTIAKTCEWVDKVNAHINSTPRKK